MDYCAVPVPASVTQALGTKGPVLVMARVNDSEPFKVSLFPTGGGQHYIRIKAKVRKETKTKTGDRVRVRFTVLDRADVTIPTDLMKALRAEGVTDDFKSLPPGKQNFIIRRIDDAAKPETRDKRIQDAVEAAHRRREKRIDQSKKEYKKRGVKRRELPKGAYVTVEPRVVPVAAICPKSLM
jgi:Domain of unknown function (DUF1905)/Bacteriocin-protection, YdeI or OmpD-Associated